MTPVKSFSLPSGRWIGIAARPKRSRMLSIVRSKLARSRSSLLITMARGSSRRSAVGPHLFSLRLDAGHGIDHDDEGIGGDQRRVSVVCEEVESGSIEEIDLGFFPLDGGNGSGDGELALDLLLVMVGDGIPFIDARQAVGRPGRKKQPGHYGSFSAMAVSCNADVSDVLCLVDLHGCLRFKNGILSHVTYETRIRNRKHPTGIGIQLPGGAC